MNAEFYFNRGINKTKVRDLLGAIEDFTTAIKLASSVSRRTVTTQHADGTTEHVNVIDNIEGNVNIYFNRACAYLDYGDYHAGIYDLTKVIQYSPNDAEAYFKRALAHSCLGNDEVVQEDLKIACNLDPKFDEKLFNSYFTT